MNASETATTDADSYEFGYVLGVNQAKTEGAIVDDETMSRFALEAYQLASRSIRMNKPEFLVGYVSGWDAYLSGLV